MYFQHLSILVIIVVVVVGQRHVRGFLQRRRYVRAVEEKREHERRAGRAASTIQAAVRGWLARRSARTRVAAITTAQVRGVKGESLEDSEAYASLEALIESTKTIEVNFNNFS